jgi:hypothetical protein
MAVGYASAFILYSLGFLILVVTVVLIRKMTRRGWSGGGGVKMSERQITNLLGILILAIAALIIVVAGD